MLQDVVPDKPCRGISQGIHIAVFHPVRIAAREAGEAVLRLLQEGVCPRDIITKAAIYNTFVVDTALGGSTNSILHLMAIAYEAGVDFSLTTVDEISRRTPHLCKISPSGEYRIEDLDRAGGVPALMKEVKKHLDLKVKRVSGLSLAEELAAAIESVLPARSKDAIT